MEPARSLAITLPDWIDEVIDFERVCPDDGSRMAVAVTLARENIRRQTGGPFGASVFSVDGRLAGVGVNRVVPLHNSVLHAEMVAFMMAQAAIGSYTLGGEESTGYELFTSCEPCAMCLGATAWSGIGRVVWAATREDAGRLHFDEGPVFNATYEYLRARGIRFEAGPLRTEARAILAQYGMGGGEIYNG
jgi:tRNA(Arg) A34 adenosine deaminase TadA